jgi:hypothetical protein
MERRRSGRRAQESEQRALNGPRRRLSRGRFVCVLINGTMVEATARQRAPLPTPRGGGDRTWWPDSNSKIIGAQQQSAARRCHCHHPSRTLLLQPTSPPGACAGWLVGRVLMGSWLVFLSFLTERHGTADSFLRVWVFAVVTGEAGAHIVGLGVVTALPVSGRRSPVSEHSCSEKVPPLPSRSSITWQRCFAPLLEAGAEADGEAAKQSSASNEELYSAGRDPLKFYSRVNFGNFRPFRLTAIAH